MKTATATLLAAAECKLFHKTVSASLSQEAYSFSAVCDNAIGGLFVSYLVSCPIVRSEYGAKRAEIPEFLHCNSGPIYYLLSLLSLMFFCACSNRLSLFGDCLLLLFIIIVQCFEDRKNW